MTRAVLALFAGMTTPGWTRTEVGRTQRVPALLMMPPSASVAAPCAAALLLHGLTSSKERMADTVGRALLSRGVASLAIDLPLHGERAGGERAGGSVLDTRNPLALANAWRTAQTEASEALDALATMPQVDGARLGLVGYSMGAFLGVAVAASQAADAIRAVVLAAGGDLPDDMPFASIVRRLADPVRSIRQLAGRPLLMVHGQHDRTVTPAQAQRLFDAAAEPKLLRWVNAGHYLPDSAVDGAAAWLASALEGAHIGKPDNRAG